MVNPNYAADMIQINKDRFKTVDDLVFYFFVDVDSDINFPYKYILVKIPEVLLHILKSKSNKPSEWDLTFIRIIHTLPVNSIRKEILEIYNNRK